MNEIMETLGQVEIVSLTRGPETETNPCKRISWDITGGSWATKCEKKMCRKQRDNIPLTYFFRTNSGCLEPPKYELVQQNWYTYNI